MSSGHSATYHTIFVTVLAPRASPIQVERCGPSTSTPNASAKPINQNRTIQSAVMRRRMNPRPSSRP